ncbi:hypothetical protein C8R46DRAFT_1092724 [Mycena filopes]|nr:hypothetical protein C8R46DRAFT_1092724 [Mycena filopes]
MIVVSDDEDTPSTSLRRVSSRNTGKSKVSPNKSRPIDLGSKIIVVRSTRAPDAPVTRSSAMNARPSPSLKRELDEDADDAFMSASPSKRAKTGSSSHELDLSVSTDRPLPANIFSAYTPRPFTKHVQFWALDGNVILQFGAVALRMHQSRLSAQSAWFEKLFAKRAGRKPVLQADEENINDVAVEELGGFDIFHLDLIGSVHDFEALLTAMEDAIAFHYALPTFPTAAAIFRAATTFKFHKFVAFTRTYLLETFPDALERLDVSVSPHAAAAVALGRKWNIPGILRRAFYELLRAPPAALGDVDDSPETTPPTLVLEPADLALLADAQKRLTAAWMTVFLRPSEAEPCPARTPCAATKRNGGWTSIAGKGKVLQRFLFDPICGLEALREVKWDEAHGFCGRCAGARAASFVAKREQIWEDMNVWLRIPVADTA